MVALLWRPVVDRLAWTVVAGTAVCLVETLVLTGLLMWSARWRA